MGIKRAKLQQGLSMAEFMELCGTGEQCGAAVDVRRWPNGCACPACSGTRHCTFERKGLTYWRCSVCGKRTTVLCGTILEATTLPLTTWFLVMHLLTQARNNVSALELNGHLGVRYKTASLLKHKLMQVMSEREGPSQLDGRVEIDDACLGGELPGGKSGRSSQNKVSFVAAVQTTDTRQLMKVCLRQLDLTREAVAAWAQTALAASAMVVSDGLWCLRAITASGGTQERSVTSGGAACVKLKQCRVVNTFRGNLKAACSGTSHAFDFAKDAHRHLAEDYYRINRRLDLSPILKRLLVAVVATTPRPERFLRAAEHCG